MYDPKTTRCLLHSPLPLGSNMNMGKGSRSGTTLPEGKGSSWEEPLLCLVPGLRSMQPATRKAKIWLCFNIHHFKSPASKSQSNQLSSISLASYTFEILGVLFSCTFLSMSFQNSFSLGLSCSLGIWISSDDPDIDGSHGMLREESAKPLLPGSLLTCRNLSSFSSHTT